MERRRKIGPRVTTSRLDPSEYDASPFAISMYPNIDEFTEHGQIVIGYIEPVGAVAIASEGRQTIAMLRRRTDETFKQLLARLDVAIAKATIDDVYVDEVNTPEAETHTSCDRSCPLQSIVDTYGPIQRKILSIVQTARK